MKSFETLNSNTVYHGKVFDVRQDTIRLPDGRQAQIDIVSHAAAVTMVPVDSNGYIWFIRQYRHAVGEVILELPAGVTERHEQPEVSAHREIQEEIGMEAGQIKKIGEFFLAPGYSTEYMYVYLATDLHPNPLPGDEDEIITVERITIPQAYQMVDQGVFRDAKTLASLLLARPFLEVLTT